MTSIKDFKNLTFLVYGLGATGKSVVNFFKKNRIKNYLVWDDKNKNLYRKKRPKNLESVLKKNKLHSFKPRSKPKKIKK